MAQQRELDHEADRQRGGERELLDGDVVRAIVEAGCDQLAAGKDPKVEIMVPLVGSVMELHLVRDEAKQILAEVGAQRGTKLKIPIGTMIELPRAALTAHRIADAADGGRTPRLLGRLDACE